MGLSVDSATKNSVLGNFGGFLGKWGWLCPKSGHPRWPTSVFHPEKKLTEARQASHSASLGEATLSGVQV